MIRTVAYISWLNLKRDYAALSMIVVLPLVFFAVFVFVLGGAGSIDEEGVRPVPILAVDLDRSAASVRFLDALGGEALLQVVALDESGGPYTRKQAMKSIRDGKSAVAVVIQPGYGASLETSVASLELLYDKADRFARFMADSSIQRAAVASAPGLFVRKTIERSVERRGDSMTAEQRQALAALFSQSPEAEPTDIPPSIVQVEMTDVRGEDVDEVSYYAAGIGVMFLLFSMAGAGSSILEEVEAGTLERILNANVGIRSLLLGKWLFFTAVAILQMSLMFVFGALFFGLDLWTLRHLAGFAVMTVVTAASAASFGLVLATVCRTRAQLNGISTIVILIMSALGGSMAPRFIMPPFMDVVAKFTFNGWALDGYLKVFWYDDPASSLAGAIAHLWPQVTVLCLAMSFFLTVAMHLGKRWETT